MQNTSHAVMAQRSEAKDAPDDYPTPPWATRALLTHVLEARGSLRSKTCLEPACGAGHMARVLEEQFGSVIKSDAFDYGYGEIRDFLTYPYELHPVDWVVTNPPFRLSEEFVIRAMAVASEGVAILARTTFLESIRRYRNLFQYTPPTKFAQFTERVPMVRGRLDRNASTATGYAWLIWEVDAASEPPQLMWIPPCRKQLERDSDYPVHMAGKSAA